MSQRTTRSNSKQKEIEETLSKKLLINPAALSQVKPGIPSRRSAIDEHSEESKRRTQNTDRKRPASISFIAPNRESSPQPNERKSRRTTRGTPNYRSRAVSPSSPIPNERSSQRTTRGTPNYRSKAVSPSSPIPKERSSQRTTRGTPNYRSKAVSPATPLPIAKSSYQQTTIGTSNPNSRCCSPISKFRSTALPTPRQSQDQFINSINHSRLPRGSVQRSIFSPAKVNLKAIVSLPPLPTPKKANPSIVINKSQLRPISSNTIEVNTDGRYKLAVFIGYINRFRDATNYSLFKCYHPDCLSFSMLEDEIISHIQARHSELKWTSYCNICQGFTDVRNDLSVFAEFQHLKDYHIAKEREQVAEEQVAEGQVAEESSETPATSPVTMVLSNETTEELALIPESPMNGLTPWLNERREKSAEITALMMKKRCLLTRYKCTNEDCSFFTYSQKNFSDHLSTHIGDAHKCPYCDFVTLGNSELADHISNEHKHERLQCSQCFYRSVSSENLKAHVLFCHLNMNPTSFKLVPAERMNINKELQSLQDNKKIETIIPPITCPLCNSVKVKFDFLEDFKAHLQTHSLALIYKCHKCLCSVSFDSLIDHLETCQQIGKFQCVYCRFGCNSNFKIRMHLAHKHPTKLELLCCRTKNLEDVYKLGPFPLQGNLSN